MRRLRGVVVVAVMALLLSSGLPPSSAFQGTITAFPITSPPAAGYSSRGITLGPDGALWFGGVDPVFASGDRIGRLDPNGTFQLFAVSGLSIPQDIVTGPDGNLWFTSYSGDNFGVITPAGSGSTFDDEDDEVVSPTGIILGPDDNLWFASSNNDRIGRIDPDTQDIVTFGPGGGDVMNEPRYLTVDHNGDLWFTNFSSATIGRITTGGDITTFTLPAGSDPVDITTTEDGDIWFALRGIDKIGHLEPDAADIQASIEAYPLFGSSPDIDGPNGITTGADGNVWFTSELNDRVGRLELLDGHITMFDDLANPGSTDEPLFIEPAPDGNLWFTNFGVDSINRVEVCNPPPFIDVSSASPFRDDICWMDGQSISTGFVPGPEYRPAANVSRSAMSAFMYRLARQPSFEAPDDPTFSDVPENSQFFTEIEWMASEGITNGFPGNLYKPGASVTRAAMSAFMYRLAGEPPFSDPPTATFTDVATNSLFFTEIEWMADEGITTGFAGNLYKPGANVTRQAMSAFMHRLYPLVPDY